MRNGLLYRGIELCRGVVSQQVGVEVPGVRGLVDASHEGGHGIALSKREGSFLSRLEKCLEGELRVSQSVRPAGAQLGNLRADLG